MNRRNFLSLTLAGTAVASLWSRSSLAVPPGIGIDVPVSFAEGQTVQTLDEISESLPVSQGIQAAYQDERAKAKTILEGSPDSVSPYEVALYFEKLRGGFFDDHYGEDAWMYSQEWPVRANPVIVSFFDATTLRQPAGDQTAWCAAFVNWCITRSGSKEGSHSAASASFRTWGTATNDPRPGDLIVFTHKTRPAQGHVAFFVSREDGGYRVLGGNQMPLRTQLPDGTYEARNTGEVNTKYFPVEGKDLKFHSFRTSTVLHKT